MIRHVKPGSQGGREPGIGPLRVGAPQCTSDTDGARSCANELERVMGIEPTLAAWEAAVLPLNYTRIAAEAQPSAAIAAAQTR